MKYNKKSVLSAIALAIIALLWGTSFAIIKDALTSIKPLTLMSLRFGLSTILLCVLFPKRLKNAAKKDICNGSIIGIFMFLSFLALVTGISYTTASKQSFLVGAYVLIVPFLAWIISKKRPDVYSIIGAVLATVGIGLLTLDSSFYINKGDLISILCSLFFAFHMVAIEYLGKDIDPIVSTIMQFAVTSILFILLTGIFESFNFIMTPKIIKAVIYLVIFTTVIAFVVQNIAQRFISSTDAAMILTLESAFGGVFAVIHLNEAMNIQMIIGCIIIFIGIITEQSKLKFIRKAKEQQEVENEIYS